MKKEQNRGFAHVLILGISVILFTLIGGVIFRSYKNNQKNNEAESLKNAVSESKTILPNSPTPNTKPQTLSNKPSPTPVATSSSNGSTNTVNNGSTAFPSQSATPIATTPNPTSTPMPSSRFAVILSPNGGETLQQGSNYQITWQSSSDITSVSLLYILSTSPNGANYITQNLANTGSYNWNVYLNGVTNSVQVKIELEAHYSSGSFSDKSNNYFTVLPNSY